MRPSVLSADLQLRRPSPSASSPSLRTSSPGLRETPKRISPMYFYDASGSEPVRPHLRAARVLPDAHRDANSRAARRRHRQRASATMRCSWSSAAARASRRACCSTACPLLARYVPVDISRSHLLSAAHGISAAYPDLEVMPVCADFTQPFALPMPRARPHASSCSFRARRSATSIAPACARTAARDAHDRRRQAAGWSSARTW